MLDTGSRLNGLAHMFSYSALGRLSSLLNPSSSLKLWGCDKNHVRPNGRELSGRGSIHQMPF